MNITYFILTLILLLYADKYTYYNNNNNNILISISIIQIKYKEKGFLKRALNAADRIIFGSNPNNVQETANTERLPVGLFPDPKLLAAQLDELENRHIKDDDNNRKMALNYVEDRLNGLTPNLNYLKNSSMAQVSDGVFSRGSKEEIKFSNQTSNSEIEEMKNKQQSLESQGQVIGPNEEIKVGKQGPVTINDLEQDKKGKTILPNLSVVEEEDNYIDNNKKKSIFNNPFVIIIFFIVIICLFSAGTLIFFKIKRKL